MDTFTEKNLAGSINFTAPGDALAEGECLALQNWRPEQRGFLRSRLREDAIPGFPSAAYNTIVGIFATGNPVQLFFADRTSVFCLVGTTYYGALAANPTGARVWFVNFQGYTWILNGGVQLRSANGTSTHQWLVSPPASALTCSAYAGSGSGGMNGTYLYACSFVTADGIESNLSPITSVSVSTGGGVNFSGIPVSSDSSVTQVWIYRSGGSQASPNPLRVQVVENGTTTASDAMSDAQATLIDIEHTQDHDPPPPADGLVGPDNYGHLFAWKGSRLYWSRSDTPWYWPGEQYEAGNYTDVGQDDEPIQCVTVKPRMILIYKLNSVWRIIGDIDTQYAVQEPIAVDRGLACPNAICSDGVMDYLEAQDGLYSCDGDRLTPLTRAVDNLWEDLAFPTTPPLDQFLPVANTPSGYFRQQQCWMARHLQNIYFTYTDQATANAAYPTLPANTVTMVYNIETKRISFDDRAWTALFSFQPQQGEAIFYAGNPQGHVVNMVGQSTSALNLNYCSRYYDFGKPRNKKTYIDLEIEYYIQDPAGQLVVKIWFNNGATFQVLGTLTGPGAATPQRVSMQLTLPVDTQAYNFAIQLQGFCAQTAIVYGFHLRYRLEQRDANTYDSGISSLGSPGLWKQVEALLVDIEQGYSCDWQLYCDGPFGMTLVDSGVMPGTGNVRTTVRIPLGQNSDPTAPISNGCIDGRLWRLVITSSGHTFRVYSAQLFGRIVGTYLVGGNETLALLPQNFGSTRLKMYRRIDIDCEGPAYSLEVKTDLPGGSLAHRSTASLSPHQRSVDKIYLPQNTRGVLLQPIISLPAEVWGAAGLKIYSARVWFKVVGEAATSSWQWADLPILPTRDTFEWMPLEVDS